ncbi:hypothetical protein L228DRAFT_84633 [Xylona heveae TC161]|uniref:C2H2-type domain-containing protein n=1 Tax=Xylona heveae (strain CBS 132557 / TC161) TaxID=1328760 RepID=A0A161THS3_XYLHT|nr:hypothetical protein L228DRAFT_84633 [Xylona heveae TC161]KZF25827.1 hypothetical protein L228DRAFT_84633 [Xylona heveae TC161]
MMPDQSSSKRYRCTFEGCGKSFSRPEHAQRHALNHSEGENTCLRCRAHFKRRDLLDRHMVRHQEKDAAAGGEGLGHLATRKRLWRDENGNVMAKRRPEHEKPARPAQKRRKVSLRSLISSDSKSSDEPMRELPDTVDYATELNEAPLSPPRSNSGSISGLNNDILLDMPSSSLDRWSVSEDISALHSLDNEDFLRNGSWGIQPLEKPGHDILFDDIFAPDTASSFNMPFTTMSYYNWLFDSKMWTHQSPGQSETAQYLPTEGQTLSNEMSRSISSIHAASENYPGLENRSKAAHDRFSETPISYSALETLAPGNIIDQQPLFPQGSLNGAENNSSPSRCKDNSPLSIGTPRLAPGSGLFSSQCVISNSSSNSRIQVECSESRDNGASTLDIPGKSSLNNSRLSVARDSGKRLPHRTSESGTQYEWPSEEEIRPREHLSAKANRLPVIDETARQGILLLIDHARPQTPDGADISIEHPLLSLGALQTYSDLYFTCFNLSYPLLHQATFQPSLVNPLLLTAVLLLGATYSDKEAHLLAVCIHDIMRVEIMSNQAFSARPSLWILQTILLVECFGKSRAGQVQHDMSHLFHGMLINLIRRSDCQSARSPVFTESSLDLNDYWKSAVDAEQRRRLALFCFMWDTQHAVLFSQSLCMNASELKLALPWDSAMWEAESAEMWFALSQKGSPPQFLSVFKSYVNPGTELPNTHLNALSRILILHGLMSVAWDLNRREQTSLGLAITDGEDTWRSRIMRSYEAWKGDFDAYCKVAMRSLSFDSEARARFQRLRVSSLAIYHAAHISLQVEIIDLQILAGAKHIIGRPVTESDYARSRQRIDNWVETNVASAVKAASHAAHLLRDGIRKLKNWDVDNVFHYPWCLYIATLTCWAFHTAGSGSNANEIQRFRTMRPEKRREAAESQNDSSLEEDYEECVDWDARAEMNMVISAMTRSNMEEMRLSRGSYGTAGLTKIMTKHLSTIRWALVREGMIVLQSLEQNSRPLNVLDQAYRSKRNGLIARLPEMR